MNRPPTRRALAAAMSGTLVAGVVAGTVVGGAGSANAAEIPIQKPFDAACKVVVGDLALGTHKIKFNLNTKAEAPLVPGTTLGKQDVSITLTMPKKLQKAVKVLKVTHAKGGSPNSGVKIRMPVHPALGGHVTNRINIKNLKAPKSKVPGLKKKWKLTSKGFVPRIHVPGFAGSQNTEPAPPFAKLRLAPRFRINATLFRKGGKRYKSTMRCTVDKADRLINGQVPVIGPYETDTVPVHAQTTARKNTKAQLVFFNIDPSSADNSWTKPKHGKVMVDPATGVATYKPNRNFTGKDSFTYTAKDDSGKSTSKVTVRVRKAPTKLKVRAPKKIRFGKRANVRVRVNTHGAARGMVRLVKGKRVLDKAKAGKAGNAKLHIKRKALKVGKHKIRVHYAGSKTAKKANAKFTLRVKKRR